MPTFKTTILIMLILTTTFRGRGHCQSGSVSGVVVLDGQPPPPTIVPLKKDMERITRKKTLSIQPWQVGKDNGLANCVITMMAFDANLRVAPKPVKGVKLQKIGPRFTPRVTVVTPGTTLTYQNKNSPCKCFYLSGRSHNVNTLIEAGSEAELEFNKRDLCQVTASLRPYMLAWIHVVDTPYYALSDDNGRFKITDVAPGKYRVRVWHEGIGRFNSDSGPKQITIVGGAHLTLSYKARPSKAAAK